MSRNKNKYKFVNDYVIVITSKKQEIKIDRDDYIKISKYSWCISKTGYAVANIKGKVQKCIGIF